MSVRKREISVWKNEAEEPFVIKGARFEYTHKPTVFGPDKHCFSAAADPGDRYCWN